MHESDGLSGVVVWEEVGVVVVVNVVVAELVTVEVTVVVPEVVVGVVVRLVVCEVVAVEVTEVVAEVVSVLVAVVVALVVGDETTQFANSPASLAVIMSFRCAAVLSQVEEAVSGTCSSLPMHEMSVPTSFQPPVNSKISGGMAWMA